MTYDRLEREWLHQSQLGGNRLVTAERRALLCSPTQQPRGPAKQLLNSRLAPVERHGAAGTMAQKLLGRLSHPSTAWLTWLYTFLAVPQHLCFFALNCP